MNKCQDKQVLTEILARFTPRSVFHLLAAVLTETANDPDGNSRESLRDAAGALFVVGAGLDSVWPGRRAGSEHLEGR